MENLPAYIGITFGLTTLLSVAIFYKASGNSKTVLWILSAWLILQMIVGLNGFYTNTDGVPPRFVLLAGPAMLFILGMFLTKRGRTFIDNLDIRALTLLHVVRVPVEMVLFWLFVYKTIPQLMTFEGRNFDILSGISAPLIYYFAFVKRSMGKTGLIIWNVICLGLLINIVYHAIFSVPTPFQKFAFDQPNIAILYFPYLWLPACVVPLVLLSHLAAFRLLGRRSG